MSPNWCSCHMPTLSWFSSGCSVRVESYWGSYWWHQTVKHYSSWFWNEQYCWSMCWLLRRELKIVKGDVEHAFRTCMHWWHNWTSLTWFSNVSALSRVIQRILSLSDTVTEHPAMMTEDDRPAFLRPGTVLKKGYLSIIGVLMKLTTESWYESSDQRNLGDEQNRSQHRPLWDSDVDNAGDDENGPMHTMHLQPVR